MDTLNSLKRKYKQIHAMDFYSANTVDIPTKRESPSSNAVGVGGMVSSHRDSIRRNSPSSNYSQDGASSMISSMQELGSNRRNLISLSELSALEQRVGLGNVSGIGDSAISTALDTHLGQLGALAESGAGLYPSLNGLLGTSGGGGGVDRHYSLAATAATVRRERINRLNAREAAAIAIAASSRFRLPTTGCSRGHDSNNSLTMEEMLSMETIMDANASMEARDREARIRSAVYSTVASSRVEQLRSIHAHAQAQALRQMKMEEIMLQHQKHTPTTCSSHVSRDHNQQRLALSEHSSSSQRRSSGILKALGGLSNNLPDGFAHKHSSSSKRCDSGGVGALGGLSRSPLDDIATAELLWEVEQRRSQRENSHDTLTGMDFGVSTRNIDPRNPSSASLVGSLGGGGTSRDHLVGLYHQMQHPGSLTTTQLFSGQQIHASGFDSLARLSREDISDAFASRRGRQQRREGVPSTTSVPTRREIDINASVTNVKAMDHPRQIQGQSNRDSNASIGASVPTAKNSSLTKSAPCIKKPRSDKQLLAAAAAALIIEGERKSSKLSGRKHKRNNSNSTSVFGDELVEQERKEDCGSKIAKVKTKDACAVDDESGASVHFSNKLTEETVMAVARRREEEAGIEVKDGHVGVEDKRRVSSNSSISEYPILSQTGEEKDTSSVSLISEQDQQIYPPPRSSLQSESSGNDKELSHTNILLLDSVQKRKAAVSSISRKSNDGNDTTEGDFVRGNYGRKSKSTKSSSLMASLEAVQHDGRASIEQAPLQDIAMRKLQTQRTSPMLGPARVPTAKNSSLTKSAPCIKKPRSDKQLLAAAAAALIIEGERKSSKLSGRKHKRNNSNSTSSCDALISVFGDELVEQERKEDCGSKTAKVQTKDACAVDDESGASVHFSNKLTEETVMAVARRREEEAGIEVKDGHVGVEDKRRVSSNSSISEYPILSQTGEEKDTNSDSLISEQDQQIYPPPPRSSLQSESSDNDKELSHANILLLDSVQLRKAAVYSISRKSNDGNDTTEGDFVRGNYGRKSKSTKSSSLMASLEAVQHDGRASIEQASLRGIAECELQTQRTASMLGPARVPTAKNSSLTKSAPCIKKPRSDKQLLAAAAAALIIEGEEKSSKLSGRKHKRNNSNSTSVFGDELVEQERKEDCGSKTAKVKTKDARAVDDESGASVHFSNKLTEETVMAVARRREEEAGIEVKDGHVGVEDKRRVSSNSSISEYPILSQTGEEKDTSSVSLISEQDQQIYPPPRSSLQSESSDSDKELSHTNILLLDSVQKRKAAISSISRKSNDVNATTEGDFVRGNYGRKSKSTKSSSLMASLEAVQHDGRASIEQAPLRDIAMRELQTQRTASMLGTSTVMADPPPGGDPERERLFALFGGRPPGGPALRNSQASAADAMMARLQGILPEGFPMSRLLPIIHHPSQIDHKGVGVLAAPVMASETHPPSSVPEPHDVGHNVDLHRFLNECGVAAEKSLKNTLEAISKTEESLANINEWDRSNGLSKCHSQTVVKTARSRARLKAFLNGLDPPKDLSTNRTENNKNEKTKEGKSLQLQPD